MSTGRHLAFPFGIGADGRSLAPGTLADEVLQELEQLVLTDPGERLFLPEFGGGVKRLIFEAGDANTAMLAQATLTQAIRNWLGGRAELQAVDVSVDGSAILITILYQLAGSTSSRQVTFQRSGL